MAAVTLRTAHERFLELAGRFGGLTGDADLYDHQHLQEDDLRQVGDLIRAADDLLEVLGAGTAQEDRDTGLRAVALAVRRLAFLVLARHVPDQAWFWTPKWQAGERQVDEEIRQGLGTVYASEEAFEEALATLDAKLDARADVRA